jgi:hypothetical protein
MTDLANQETVADLLVLTRRFLDASNAAGALAGAAGQNAPAFLVDDRPAVASLARMTLSGKTGGPTTAELEILSRELRNRRVKLVKVLHAVLPKPQEAVPAAEEDVRVVRDALAEIRVLLREFDELLK